MARTDSLSNFLTDIANTIRSRKDSNDPIPASDFDVEINNLFNNFDAVISGTANSYINPNISNVGDYAFYGNSFLTTVRLDNVTSIGTNSFGQCESLTALIIPNMIMQISLASINAFVGTPIESGTGYIYVDDGLVDTYKSAENWSRYASQIKGISELDVS